AARAEHEERVLARSQDREDRAREGIAAGGDGPRERDEIQRGAAVEHERQKPEIVAEASQRRSKSPESGVAPAAAVAPIVVDADQRAARGADHRAGLLPEHTGTVYFVIW